MIPGTNGKCPHPLFQLSYNEKQSDILRTVLAMLNKTYKDIKSYDLLPSPSALHLS